MIIVCNTEKKEIIVQSQKEGTLEVEECMLVCVMLQMQLMQLAAEAC